jgi:hypothetical protein
MLLLLRRDETGREIIVFFFIHRYFNLVYDGASSTFKVIDWYT